MSSKCGACDKAVYAAEERRFGDVAYHRQCFKCSMCSKPVDSTTGAQHQRTLYCKTCHGREFGIKGYGFGQGAGVLNTEKAQGPGGAEGGASGASKQGQQRTVSPSSGGCPRCGQRVYDAEKAIGCPGDLKFHKRCFRCQTCGKSLDSTNLATKDLEIYCKTCYGKHFGPKGFGFGQGAGTLNMG
ncbi:unnamed protein product [Hymenolepis diminuta]|uniref:LIM zinc-binding domain-containing protein n=1 Tax=Hymenolepis diminuta TaxID=6216 RepID=A0A0R3SVT0_HYMDI|nr:unnamed protein product [Hymenolepis diminuta]VUZ41961.1 unnamed protein product [Hymenolepis diminuta]